MFTGFPGDHVVLLNWRDLRRQSAGDADLFCSEVAGELAERGVRVSLLVCSSRRHPASAVARPGVDVVDLGAGLLRYLRVVVWLLRRRRRIDAVVDCRNGVPSFSPLLLPKRVPVLMLVLHVHQHQLDDRLRWPLRRVGAWLEGPVTRRVYGRRPVAAVSPSARSDVRRSLRLQGRAFVTPFGQRVPGDVPRARAAHPQIVCVGRLERRNRWEAVIGSMPRVLRDHPDAQLHLVGTGREREALDALVVELGLQGQVVLHGALDDAARDQLLASAWVSSSASAGEGWGLTLMEAAAVGVPAVALDAPGLRDAVRDGETGWLARDEQVLPDALATALSVLRDEQVAGRCARRCREWAGTFSWAATANRLVVVLTAEARRLRLGAAEQRIRNDVATIVHVPWDLSVDPAFTTLLRGTDQWMRLPDGSSKLLLAGADEADALIAMDRLGIPSNDPSVTVALARPRDLLGWPGGLPPAERAALPGQRPAAATSTDAGAPGPIRMTGT